MKRYLVPFSCINKGEGEDSILSKPVRLKRVTFFQPVAERETAQLVQEVVLGEIIQEKSAGTEWLTTKRHSDCLAIFQFQTESWIESASMQR